MKRNLSADEPGIAALRHDGRGGVVADARIAETSSVVRGLRRSGLCALIFAAPLDEMRRDLVRVLAEAFRMPTASFSRAKTSGEIVMADTRAAPPRDASGR